MKDGNGLYCSGIGITGLLQHHLSAYEDTILFCSHIGDPRYAFLILFPLTYCLDKYLGLKVLWTSAITEWLNAILKWCARDDRPYWWKSTDCFYSSKELKQFQITCESGPGFPSGHVMSTSSLGMLLLLYIMSCVRSRNGKLVVFGVLTPAYIALLVLVSVSRIYIATHFPHQVIVGGFVGASAAFCIDYVTSRNSSKMLFTRNASVIGIMSLLVALILYYMLLFFDFDPMSSVELALAHCKTRSWVRLDTTLFFAVVRDAGSLSGIGVVCFIFTACFSREKSCLFSRSNKSIFSWLASLVLGLIFSYLFLYVESFVLPEKRVIMFYLLAFVKFLCLPCFVIVVEYILRIIGEICYEKKIKIYL